MLSLPLGPLAIPLAPLQVLLALLLAYRVAKWQGSKAGEGLAAAAADTVLNAALLGLLAARASYLAWYARAYLASPWAMLDLRDGGWHPAAGWTAAVTWLLWHGYRHAALRRALAAAAGSGAALWLGAVAFTSAGAGTALPTLSLAPLKGGESLSLTQAAQGRPVVLNLWASWCGPCRQEMPMLDAAQRRYPHVAFLFVNQGETAVAAQAYLREQGLGLREVLLDPAAALGPILGSRGLPTTLFFDAGGRLVAAHLGVLNAAALEARLQRLPS